ncbi:hemerythrin domain-containing protein [Phenylobacterium sp.]|uniref:hemerythrin domain-containing protein n=1 Tax=Phenylobacterium sp. TaxID=1871053 RepID=UPI002ED79F93
MNRPALQTPLTPRASASHGDVARLAAQLRERGGGPSWADIAEAIQLAQRVEARHARDPDRPVGLADHLAALSSRVHTLRVQEEHSLLPLLITGGRRALDLASRLMMSEHVDVEVLLLRLRELTRTYASRLGAAEDWCALSRLCNKLEADLRAHLRQEDEVLYAALLN